MHAWEEKPQINVGIPVIGEPRLARTNNGLTRLRNMSIGLGFHWQCEVEALLPGEIVRNDSDPVYRIINRVPIETYLECVVGSEMNPAAPAEFLKAHAVISRCWALGKITGCHSSEADSKINEPGRIIDWEDTCDHHGFDVCSDDHCQRYQGVQPMSPEIKKAIRATAGEILLDASGNLVDTRFSKCCGGITEVFSSCWQPREESGLTSVDDPWCDLSQLSPDDRLKVLRSILKDYDLINGGGFQWEAITTAEEVKSRLHQKFNRDIGEILDIAVVKRGPSGRAILLSLKGSEGELELGKELMIRRLLAPAHLYSSRIEIEHDATDRGIFHIHGRGWGHGVGLCQIGAARMALEGFDYRAILSHYYPGSHLVAQTQSNKK